MYFWWRWPAIPSFLLFSTPSMGLLEGLEPHPIALPPILCKPGALSRPKGPSSAIFRWGSIPTAMCIASYMYIFDKEGQSVFTNDREHNNCSGVSTQYNNIRIQQCKSDENQNEDLGDLWRPGHLQGKCNIGRIDVFNKPDNA